MNIKEITDIKRNDYIKSLLNIPPNDRNEKVLLELMSFTKHFKLFDTIGMTNEHAYICKSMGLAHYKPNEVIVRQGDKGDSFFYILSGIVKIIITKKYDLGPEQGEIKIDKYIGDLKAGQTFGELSLIYGTERSATIVAVTNATMIRIDKISFDTYVKDIFETQLKDEIDFMKVCPIFHKVDKEQLK
jgi:signal-transduction protein with cAMP-binding, CBS, and nucleotidyltransferase domain